MGSTHFAGLQVFFQALFNINTIVYLFEKKFNEVYFDFVKYEITHISCTPTFMKMFLPSVKKDLIDVRSITFGGEKFDSKIEKELEKKFSNATVKNIYASTEAGSLLKGEGEFFLIPKRYNELIKIKNNELLIHKELLGASESFNLVGDWYNTGDIVEFKDEKRFKFINRKSEIINVGGYNVNPFEVESIIKEIIGVKDVIVFGDHTRILKLINFDFARGADGTQVLLSKEERVPQHFFYHSLLKIDLSNYGYARHFKFLKDTKTIMPSIDIANQFEEKAKIWYDMVWANMKQNQKLAEVRDWLLPMLMNGQVRVN